MPTIAFIACSKTKKSAPCFAKEMYQGALFKKAYSYCSQNFDQVFILSAKYGVLFPDQIIEPYNITIKDMDISQRKSWSLMVSNQLKEIAILGDFYFFAGQKYTEFLSGKKPFNEIGDMRIGKQLKWFSDRIICKKGLGII